MLSGQLLTNLRMLYAKPPPLADTTSDVSDLHRLAHMAALYMPDVVLPVTTSSHPEHLCARPYLDVGADSAVATSLALATGASSASTPMTTQVIDLASPSRKLWMIHDELYPLLWADA